MTDVTDYFKKTLPRTVYARGTRESFFYFYCHICHPSPTCMKLPSNLFSGFRFANRRFPSR